MASSLVPVLQCRSNSSGSIAAQTPKPFCNRSLYFSNHVCKTKATRSIRRSSSISRKRNNKLVTAAMAATVGMGNVMAVQTPSAAQRSAEADVMGLLLRERIVILGSSIDDFVADVIVSQLLLLDASEPKRDIKLFINSTGGPINATLGIFDAIQLCRADVQAIALGCAASSASIVLGGGSKGKRFSMPNARIMMHQPFGSAGGPVADVEIQAKEVMYQKTTVIRILSEVTGRDPKQVEKDIDRDCYMSPMEAADYGLIDGVIDRDFTLPRPPIPEDIKLRPDYMMTPDGEDYVEYMTPKIPDDELL